MEFYKNNTMWENGVVRATSLTREICILIYLYYLVYVSFSLCTVFVIFQVNVLAECDSDM